MRGKDCTVQFKKSCAIFSPAPLVRIWPKKWPAECSPSQPSEKSVVAPSHKKIHSKRKRKKLITRIPPPVLMEEVQPTSGWHGEVARITTVRSKGFFLRHCGLMARRHLPLLYPVQDETRTFFFFCRVGFSSKYPRKALCIRNIAAIELQSPVPPRLRLRLSWIDQHGRLNGSGEVGPCHDFAQRSLQTKYGLLALATTRRWARAHTLSKSSP